MFANRKLQVLMIACMQIDTVVQDVKDIMEKGLDDIGRPPKIIIYSNFPKAFDRFKDFLSMEAVPPIPFAYAAVAPRH
jgi:hypothetical protein